MRWLLICLWPDLIYLGQWITLCTSVGEIPKKLWSRQVVSLSISFNHWSNVYIGPETIKGLKSNRTWGDLWTIITNYIISYTSVSILRFLMLSIIINSFTAYYEIFIWLQKLCFFVSSVFNCVYRHQIIMLFNPNKLLVVQLVIRLFINICAS